VDSGGKDGVDGEGSGVEGGDGDGAELGRLEAGSWLGVGEVGSRDLRRMAKGIRFAAGQLWTGDGGEAWRTGDDGDTEFGWLRVDGGWTARTDDGGDTLRTGGGGGGTKVGCFGAGGGGERLRAGSSGDTENGRRIAGTADVGGVGVASARRGPLSRLSDGGGATRSETGDGAGAGAADRAGALATKSVDEVGVSGTGGEDAWAEDGVGRAGSPSPKRCNIVVFIIRTRSWTCRSKLGLSLTRSPG